MRKLLLASVATLGTGGLTGAAFAQGSVGAPTQGQAAYPMAPSPTAYVNNNNNYQAPALPGALANPTPGTIVVHINGKVQVDFWGTWTSADKITYAAPAAGSTGAAIGNNGVGTVKLQPQEISSFGRLYAGADGMATNGLRYGAAIEVRQNFTGQISGVSSSGASGYSSLETLYVRRAFTYVAGENWGIVRAGQADGLIGIFDNGVTTFQFLPTGNLNGGDLTTFAQAVPPQFIFLGQAGNEYDNAKLVYLSPQIAGFDFGVQYAPNTSNGFGMGGSNLSLNGSITGSGTGTGLSCAVASTGCPGLSSGPGAQDGSRALNQTGVGVRYQGAFGSVGVLAYGVFMFSGHADYSGQAARVVPTAANPTGLGPGAANLSLSSALAAAGSTYTGNFDGLKVGSGGLAVTFAGFTVGGNVIGGSMNGQLGLRPQGGAPLFGYLLGAKYVNGPFTVGIAAEEYWEQGTVQMSGLTQRRGRGLSTGVSYAVAPGYTVYGEYLYMDQQQNGVNLLTTAGSYNGGTLLSPANNNARGQGFLVGNVVNF